MEIIVGESIVLPCQVTSDPVLDVSFSWAFNGQLIAKGDGHFELVGGVSDPAIILLQNVQMGSWHLFPSCFISSPAIVQKDSLWFDIMAFLGEIYSGYCCQSLCDTILFHDRKKSPQRHNKLWESVEGGAIGSFRPSTPPIVLLWMETWRLLCQNIPPTLKSWCR